MACVNASRIFWPTASTKGFDYLLHAFNPERILMRAQTRAFLDAGLRLLTPRERAALLLRDVEELPAAEVARLLNCSKATVRSHIANARTTDAGRGKPYRRLEAVLKAQKDEISGVEIDRITADTSDFQKVLNPGNPKADKNGYVSMPNVSLPVEMMNLSLATRTYQANAAVLKRYQQMVETTLELLR